MFKQCTRQFSASSRVYVGYSTVEPVHHTVPIKKFMLGSKFDELKLEKDDIRRPSFKPKDIYQDRVIEHYYNTIQPDLLLHLYQHDAKVKIGEKKRQWDVTNPFSTYRTLRKPRGLTRSQKNVKPITDKNIPQLTAITINLYNRDALENPWANISSRLQIAQITNVKPKLVKNKSNVLPWKVRAGKPCGCKVELTGRDMTRFLSTLTELVLPRIRTFKGIKETSGDKTGNISFGFTSEEAKLFPEIEQFADLYPNLWGFHVTFKTTAGTDERARTLLSSFGLPFYKPVKNSN